MTGHPPEGDRQSGFRVLIEWADRVIAHLLLTWRRSLSAMAVGAVLATGVALLLHNQYTTNVTFIAQSQESQMIPAALQGLAATIGLNTGNDFSPKFYADLFTSRPVLAAAVRQRYAVGSRQLNYLDIESIDTSDTALASELGMKELTKHVSAQADVRTDVISLSVTARYPELSRDIALRLLAAMDTLNIHFRQEQSRDLRVFYQDRFAEVEGELKASEDSLQAFLEVNRSYENSPILTFRQARLQRSVDLWRSVYLTVVQQLEQARMEESRNVPVTTVLAAPYVPQKKSGPPRRLIVVLGALLGLAFPLLRGWTRTTIAEFHSRHPDAWDAMPFRRRRSAL